MTLDLRLGDCLDVLRTMPDCSVDACVTDPPYGLSFMGKKWDYDVPTVEVWREVFRVLKPGGHLLAFAGTRTQHRMAVNIEDAGFEIRDCIMWHYGSGFPKSLDISKQLDKMAGATRKIVSEKKTNSGGMAHISKTNAEHGFRPAAYTGNGEDKSAANVIQVTAPATPEAQQWSGWGTALKPATEIITMARRPLEGTVAENVLRYGTGGINVDGCRVGTDGGTTRSEQAPYAESGWRTGHEVLPLNAGRWPANLIHDGSDEVVRLFPQAAAGSHPQRPTHSSNAAFGGGRYDNSSCYGDSGTAARFFYTAKAAKSERQGVTHPTVKPLDLMAYLCRLVTPPGGIVLDPFMGTGTTIKAAISEGFQAIGIERDPQYFAMAQHRLNGAQLGLGLEGVA